ncbi:hypothetical protein E2C01_036753 [Portunus trituberculatus]|uniref:Uncharacterized protein n=1 Tax=Portunus trituberculatus TaxID=210409 RepID=A0A5B7FC77_PORTR|nr:hypothetical protein [Portunus trituberculatus]
MQGSCDVPAVRCSSGKHYHTPRRPPYPATRRSCQAGVQLRRRSQGENFTSCFCWVDFLSGTEQKADPTVRRRGTVLAHPSDSDSLIGFGRETRCLFIVQHTVIAQPLLPSCCGRCGWHNEYCWKGGRDQREKD